MIAQDSIIDYLIRSMGKSYCDDCLSTALEIPLHQVEEETIALAEESWTKRWDGSCVSCSAVKLLSKRRTGSFAA